MSEEAWEPETCEDPGTTPLSGVRVLASGVVSGPNGVRRVPPTVRAESTRATSRRH